MRKIIACILILSVVVPICAYASWFDNSYCVVTLYSAQSDSEYFQNEAYFDTGLDDGSMYSTLGNMITRLLISDKSDDKILAMTFDAIDMERSINIELKLYPVGERRPWKRFVLFIEDTFLNRKWVIREDITEGFHEIIIQPFNENSKWLGSYGDPIAVVPVDVQKLKVETIIAMNKRIEFMEEFNKILEEKAIWMKKYR